MVMRNFFKPARWIAVVMGVVALAACDLSAPTHSGDNSVVPSNLRRVSYNDIAGWRDDVIHARRKSNTRVALCPTANCLQKNAACCHLHRRTLQPCAHGLNQISNRTRYIMTTAQTVGHIPVTIPQLSPRAAPKPPHATNR